MAAGKKPGSQGGCASANHRGANHHWGALGVDGQPNSRPHRCPHHKTQSAAPKSRIQGNGRAGDLGLHRNEALTLAAQPQNPQLERRLSASHRRTPGVLHHPFHNRPFGHLLLALAVDQRIEELNAEAIALLAAAGGQGLLQLRHRQSPRRNHPLWRRRQARWRGTNLRRTGTTQGGEEQCQDEEEGGMAKGLRGMGQKVGGL